MGWFRILVILYILAYITVYFALVGALLYVRSSVLRGNKYVDLIEYERYFLNIALQAFQNTISRNCR